MKMTTFWHYVPCSLAETSVYFNEATRCYIPEGCRSSRNFQVIICDYNLSSSTTNFKDRRLECDAAHLLPYSTMT
jgi:hypothetical protein